MIFLGTGTIITKGQVVISLICCNAHVLHFGERWMRFLLFLLCGYFFSALGFGFGVGWNGGLSCFIMLPGVIVWGFFSGNSFVYVLLGMVLLSFYRVTRFSHLLMLQTLISFMFGFSMGVPLPIVKYLKVLW